MKDLSNVSVPSETIGIMKDAMEAAIASLPDPVSSTHSQSIAETILRTAKDGRVIESRKHAMSAMALFVHAAVFCLSP
jgi:hypothetical protein